MHPELTALISNCAFPCGPDGIYSAPLPTESQNQDAEQELRERVAAQQYDDYLATIAHHHSIPAMDYDYEVDHYAKCLLCPGMRITFSGRLGSWVGQLDAYLGALPWLGRWIARQRSFEAQKISGSLR